MRDDVKQYSYLSGATLYMMLVEAKKETNKEGLEIANYQILAEMAEIFRDEEIKVSFVGRSAVQQASKYRSGAAGAPMFMRFYEKEAIDAFDERLKKSTASVLNRISEFIDDYLYIDPENPWLVYALFDLITNDENIDDEDEIFIDDKGKSIFKKDLEKCTDISVPHLILGIWSYTLHHSDDRNRVRGAYENLTKRGRNNEKHVDRDLFSWKTEVAIKKYKELPMEVAVSDAEDDGTLYLAQHDDVAPDMKTIPPEKIVVLKNGVPQEEKETPYQIYLKSIRKKHSVVYNFLYKSEKVLDLFYVCNDLALKSYNNFLPSEWEDNSYIVNSTIERLPLSICKYMVITAEGGMGKSMFMHYLTVNAVDCFRTFKKIPIFITARLYNKFKGNLLDLILSEYNRHNHELVKENLFDLLTSGNALILIDGLDEISPDRTESFFDELEYFVDQYSENYIVVSTRRHVNARALSKFATYELAHLRYEQVIEMVGKIDEAILNEGVPRDFIDDLKNKRAGLDWDKQSEFLGNPLLLNIMLLTYSETRLIRAKKYLFYEDAYNALADKHDATKGLTREFKTGLEKREFQKLFGEFCAMAYAEDESDFKEDVLYDYLERIIKANRLDISVESVIADITEKLCLMFKDGEEYHFIHKTFMEYFAAYFFSKQDARYFDNIYHIFMRYDETRHDDEALSMLYGMAEQQAELHIIMPYLKELIESHFNYAGEPPQDTYFEFLERIYPCLYFYDGEYNCEDYMQDSESAIYNFIRDNYKISHTKMMEAPGMGEDSFVLQEFYYVPENPEDPDDPGEYVVMEQDNIEYDISDPDVNITHAGYIYEVPVMNLCQRPEVYKDLLDKIFSENFVLYKEYRDIVKLYEDLKRKYSDRRADNGHDFISMFH